MTATNKISQVEFNSALRFVDDTKKVSKDTTPELQQVEGQTTDRRDVVETSP